MNVIGSAARQRRRMAVGAVALSGLLCAPVAAVPAATAGPSAASPSAADVRADQWWLDVLGAEEIWQRHTRGEGVVVAVIDGGVEPSGDLEGAVLPGFTQTGSGRGDSDGAQNFHGTVMATKIAGRGSGQGVMGVAPAATILPVKIPTLNQADYTARALRTLAAMDDPPEIVNMSYNGYGSCTSEEQAAVRTAVDAGMILVASAGNNGAGGDLASSPASCAGVIAVGAYGFFGNLVDRPDLRMWPDSEQRDYVALAAPGIRMIAFEPGSEQPSYYDGTSDAAAIVSGSLALVRGAFPDVSSREIVARVLATARPLDDRYGVRSAAWGFGSVRPFNAIEDDVAADAPNAVYDALDRAAPPTGTPEGGGASRPPGAGQSAPSESADAGASADSGDGLLIGLAAGAGIMLVVALLVIGVVASRRRRSSPAGPGWPT